MAVALGGSGLRRDGAGSAGEQGKDGDRWGASHDGINEPDQLG